MSSRNVFLPLFTIVTLCFTCRIIASMQSHMNRKTWTYELKSIDTQSSDEDQLCFDWHVDRVSRGVYSMSGEMKMNMDIVEGDDTEIEIICYRSRNGIEDYKVTPFVVPRQHVFDYFNTFYKDMIMGTLKDCSDLPVFKDKFIPPFEKKTYTLDKCQFSEDNFPQHMQEGFYKVVVSGYGTVVWSLNVIVEIEMNS